MNELQANMKCHKREAKLAVYVIIITVMECEACLYKDN